MRPARSLKQKLKESLPPPLKLSLKRMVLSSIGAAIRLAGRAYKFAGYVISSAETQGLNVREAWDGKAAPQPPLVQPWGGRDFLFLMRIRDGARQRHAPSVSDRLIRASIIIPVFNKIEFTFQCLRSLLQEIDFNVDEVIVVDNASLDETAQVLAHFGDFVQVIHNAENRGFVDACNQGAAVARGRYLVFLNNDTVVLPGWLKHLVETVEREPSIGAAG
ncbi:MAG: glycosyltransferase family 2 protein, partial [Acidobacteriota bacterium]|nr:glycosyltransferase family 2 protein [Acidobacteriota bacterium]